MAAVVEYRTLEHVARQARPYPARLLEGHRSGLLLFSAAFLGHNDGIHFAMAGLNCCVVDTDRERLDTMEALYPHDWCFHNLDAWAFAEMTAGKGERYDAVSVDPFTREMQAAADSIELWCSVAAHLVTLGIDRRKTEYKVPAGWQGHLLERSSAGIYWLVMEREV